MDLLALPELLEHLEPFGYQADDPLQALADSCARLKEIVEASSSEVSTTTQVQQDETAGSLGAVPATVNSLDTQVGPDDKNVNATTYSATPIVSIEIATSPPRETTMSVSL